MYNAGGRKPMDSATENNRLDVNQGKGENVR